MKNDTRTALRATSLVPFEKYLRLPPLIGRGKSLAFQKIKSPVHKKKIGGWKEKILFQAGRKILIITVVQAISIYALGCFSELDGFCSELNSLMSRVGLNYLNFTYHHISIFTFNG